MPARSAAHSGHRGRVLSHRGWGFGLVLLVCLKKGHHTPRDSAIFQAYVVQETQEKKPQVNRAHRGASSGSRRHQ